MASPTKDETYDEIIEQKTMKLNGEVLYKRYGKRKFLGKGISDDIKVDSPSATKESTWRPNS
jgi:hypothetical protein